MHRLPLRLTQALRLHRKLPSKITQSAALQPDDEGLRETVAPLFLAGFVWAASVPSRHSGARGRSRTADTMIFSHVLYQLSYPGNAAATVLA